MKRKRLAIVLIAALIPALSFAQGQNFPGSSSGSASSQGPVINVTNATYAGGVSSANADNNAQFTAAVTALNAATSTGPSSSGVGTPVSGSNQGSVSTTLTISMTYSAGTTVVCFVMDNGTPRAITITDSGGSKFTQISNGFTQAASGTLRLFMTAPGAAKASTLVTLTNNGASETLSFACAAYPNVSVVYNQLNTQTATTTTMSVSQTTTRQNSSIVAACGFFNSNVATFSATTGTLRTSQPSSASTAGLALLDNPGTSLGSVTDAGTFSASTNSNCTTVELQSNGTSTQRPTLYVPAGFYFYSGGIAPTVPMTLKCDDGAILYYTGNAHAADFGPTGLSTLTASSYPYYVDGCTFTGAGTATQGLFFNTALTVIGIRNTRFENFGPPSTNTPATDFWMVAANGSNWDVEIGPQVRVQITDGIGRNFYRTNLALVDAFSFSRVHNIEMYCYTTTFFGNSRACSPQPGIGMYLDSSSNIVDGNSLAFFNPDIEIAGNSGISYANRIEHNIINAPQGTGVSACQSPLMLLGTQQANNIHDNIFEMNGCPTTSPVGATGATLSSNRINFNQADLLNAATPFVSLSNIVGQTNNQSSNNMCNTAQGTGTFSPCPVPHTTGSNITAFTFNLDDNLTATGAQPTITGTGACATVSTQKGSWSGQVTCTGTTGASTLIITAGPTAPNSFNCVDAHDITNVLTATRTAESATACTFSFTSVTANDVIKYTVLSY